MDSSLGKNYFEGSKFITDTDSGRVSLDATFLIASLLVYAAKSDGSISQLETGKMIDTLSSRLGMRNAEAMDHLTAAVMHMTDAGDITPRLHQLSKDLSHDERTWVFSVILEIVMVDGQLDPGEHQAVISAGQILRLSEDKIHSELRSITSAPS